jgi:hypothetical protein
MVAYMQIQAKLTVPIGLYGPLSVLMILSFNGSPNSILQLFGGNNENVKTFLLDSIIQLLDLIQNLLGVTNLFLVKY